MKHLYKKTVEHLKLEIDQDVVNLANDMLEEKLQSVKTKDLKKHHIILIKEDGSTSRSFFYNINGKQCVIPLSNPVLIYLQYRIIFLIYLKN